MAKENHSESGRHRGERREHDREERAYEEQTVTAWHQSPTVRVVGIVLVVLVSVAMTALFVGGLIKW
jgi:hypothetical protein